MPLLSVVVPVYKAERSLLPLYERLTQVLGSQGYDYELVFVEDNGGDGSWALIEQLAARDARVRGLKLSTNFGQHAATIGGIAHARGEWIATMDCDLEHRPEDLPLLLARAQEGYDIVYGVFPTRTHSAWRNLTSHIARAMFRAAIPSLNYDYTSFRVLSRHVAQVLPRFNSPFTFVDGYLSWVSNRYATVPVTHDDRLDGGSTYTFRKLATHTINIFVTFSDLPLRLASWIGLCAFFLGVLGLAVIVGMKLVGGIGVSGWASMMAGMFAFSGVQLLILGIFGEYLSRLNFKSSNKPMYIVAHEAGAAS